MDYQKRTHGHNKNSRFTMSVEFSLPQVIKDFVFDLHDAIRRSQNISELQKLYDIGLKEITEKYFSSSPWPDSNLISPEVRGDEAFLLLYRCIHNIQF